MKHRRDARRILLVGFFLLMLLCTVLSRIYDSVTVPKVMTVFPSRKSVETVITGTGTVREVQMSFCGIEPGLRVEAVAVSPGSVVKVGDELFRFQPASLKEKREELETELRRARLNEERLRISAETYEDVSQSELAERELLLAQQELARGQADHEVRWEEHLAQLEKLKKDYEKRKNLTEEELLQQQMRQMDSAHGELRSAQASRREEIRAAERKIEDLEAEIEEAEELDPDLEKELARAREDLEDLERQWDSRIINIEEDYDILDDQSERIEKGETSGQQALKEAYEADVKQEEDAWKAEEKALEELERKVEDAQWNQEVAARRDAVARMTADQKKRLSEVERRLQELEITSLEKEIGRIDGLIGADGVVTAGQDGTVILQELAAGKTSTGEERLSIAYGNRMFEAEFDKEGQELSVGDRLTIAIPGSSRQVEARVDSLNLLGEETGTFQADLEELDLPIGTVTTYECRKGSEAYPTVIPLEALRKDMTGYYCLAVRTRKAVLGEEFWAERVELTVLQKGDRDVAVEGAILESDRLISAGNRIVNAGDRVRPVEDLGA